MEIGSVLELERWEMYAVSEKDDVFYLPFMKDKKYKTVFYQSGRNAIESLLILLKKEFGIKKILLPDYMCDTVKDAAKRAEVVQDYYKIDRNYDFKSEEIESKLSKDACLFVAHFFGKKINERSLSDILKWKEQGVTIIEDITLSMFSSDNGDGIGFGHYTLGSVRKWLPVPDGGFIASYTNKLPEQLKSNCVSKYTDFYYMVQVMKKEYVENGYQNKTLKNIYMDYYSLSIKELFSDYTLYPISDWTKNYLKNYDMQEVIEKRKKNYDYLYEGLSKINWLRLAVRREDGYLPFGMVVQAENRDELLQYLIKNNIYCNVHWRLDNMDDNDDAVYLTQHSITIPCDQRYDLEEMDYIINTLERWQK